MTFEPRSRRVLGLTVGVSLLWAPAAAAGAGGATFPTASGAGGGAQYGSPMRGVPKPVATRFSVSPARVVQGASLPKIALRIDDEWTGTLRTRIVFTPVRGTHGRLLSIDLGRITPGRALRAPWPRGAVLVAGRYTVRLHATDAGGRVLQRTATRPGRATLTVAPPARPKPVAKPKPTPPVLAPVTPAGPATSGVFPVQGPHSYGDGFGAQRSGYSHQGVDVLAAEGTPVVAPVAGTIRFTDYQASAAGYYVVEYATDGRAFFFAHCQKGSVSVQAGQAVSQGAPLCLVGHTGDATGPHLHFEMWPSGWRDVKGTAPADPGPQLRAWDS